MPYYRRTRRTYRRRYARPYQNNKKIKRIVRAEIRKDDRKDHPLEWIDVKYTGDYIKTTPTMLSFTNAIRNQILNNNSWESWPTRYDSTQSQNYRQSDVYITGYQYQLRFQQNDQASEVYTDTVRSVMYTFEDTYDQDSTSIFTGGDVDQPPATDKVMSMHQDRIFTLRPGLTETGTDDSQFVPGTRTLKGFKKTNLKLTMEYRSGVISVEEKDMRWEALSDDASIVGEVQLYGFFRIYYRVM